MTRPFVRHVEPPAGSLIADWYQQSRLLDSYAVDLSAGSGPSMRELARLALGNRPAWFRSLLAIRDAAMRPLGIKSSNQLRDARASGERVDFFPILLDVEMRSFWARTIVMSISACPCYGRRRAPG